MKNELDVIYCKDCRSFSKTQVDKDSAICTCARDSNKFEFEEPALYKHRNCFREKKSNGGVK